jgi:hypothetical protein
MAMRHALEQAVAMLPRADLTGADLTDAVLRGADLTGADLTDAVLRGAVLRDAVLTDAVLTDADLRGAVLTGADLRGADLTDADLTGADLTGAVLAGADLTGADLRGADLTGAVLTDAVLRGAVLAGADGKSLPRATPEQAIENLDKVREIILDDKERLEMGHWHGNSEWLEKTCAEETLCGTTHCLAGWLQVCTTEPALKSIDAELAGILAAPVASKMFFKGAEEVLTWLEKREYAA